MNTPGDLLIAAILPPHQRAVRKPLTKLEIATALVKARIALRLVPLDAKTADVARRIVALEKRLA